VPRTSPATSSRRPTSAGAKLVHCSWRGSPELAYKPRQL
jgi:hypothetical protein